ncbi:MAG: ribonuclease R, partial [Longimicrobiales bacterium]
MEDDRAPDPREMTSPDRIIEYLRSVSGRPLKAKELAHGLEIGSDDYAEFKDLLHEMEERGQLYRVQRQRYAAPRELHLVVGHLSTVRSGAGFVSPDDQSGDVFIPAEALESALDGDRVVARIERSRLGQRREGTIIKILQRARETIVGVYHPEKNYGFVTPEDPKLVRSVFVPPGQDSGAAAGQVVVVRISSWGDRQRGPAGEIERVLGTLGAPGVDVLAVIYGHELPVEFPSEVEETAVDLQQRGIVTSDLDGRTDLRGDLVFTIDPVDAKDHDDALSVRRLENGSWDVGIHIADVSFYVREGTTLDAEALRRGTSVYLVDRTIPMLPHALSGDLCSLLPDRDRLTISVLVQLDADANVVRHQLVRSVIRSRHKLSYEQAQRVLNGSESIDPETDQALADLNALSGKLRTQRFARGSLDFDLPEARVTLSPSGEPTDIKKIERLESHRLIEDFMLLANETVARRAAQARMPFIYRIHEAPDEARLEQLREFAKTFGHRLSARKTPSPMEIQSLLQAIKGRPEEKLLATVVLRSMKQARYSAENLGHFGLAARYYTHFTSPIRRYPDLVAHRLAVRAFVDRAAAGAATAHLLPDIARIASERERVAVEAERDSIELKKVEFMQQHLGSEFSGTISGVAQFGVFVLLDEYYVDGLVHVSSLEDDYYSFFEEQYALVGEHSGQRFRLGDRVRVQVVAVHLEARKIDFL